MVKIAAIILALTVNFIALVAVAWFTGTGVQPPEMGGEDKLDEAMADSIAAEETAEREAPAQEIKQEMASLEKQRREMEAEIIRVEMLRSEVENLLRQKRDIETQRIEQLAKLYESMKGNEVALVMEGLSDSLIVQILPKMKERQAAKVLSAIQPGRAARISRMMTTLE